MSCLIQLHAQPDWMNVDSIQNAYVYSVTQGWAIEYEGPSYYEDAGSQLGIEVYTTKTEIDLRMAQIEKLVNSKCGTNLKITLKNK